MAEEIGILETLTELKKREPFVPFSVVVASGDRYVIEDADMFVIGATQVIYCYPRSDRVVFLRFSQIVAIEQFQEKPAA